MPPIKRKEIPRSRRKLSVIFCRVFQTSRNIASETAMPESSTMPWNRRVVLCTDQDKSNCNDYGNCTLPEVHKSPVA